MWKLLACVSNEVKRLENNHHCLLCFKGPIRIFWIAAIGKIHSLWPSWRLWNDHGSNSGLELDRLDFTFAAAVDGLSAAFPPPLKNTWNCPRSHISKVDNALSTGQEKFEIPRSPASAASWFSRDESFTMIKTSDESWCNTVNLTHGSDFEKAFGFWVRVSLRCCR